MAAKYLFGSKTLIALPLIACLGQAALASPSPEPAVVDPACDCDQLIAHIPSERAAIASVALARLNIALHTAKIRAERSLCQGDWSPSGETLQQAGPTVIASGGSDKVWAYQSLRRAQPLNCGQVSRTRFFQEMSRYLPPWVSIRPAGQTTAFNQGIARSLPSSYLAVR